MGHIGDGNIHPNIALDLRNEQERQNFEFAKKNFAKYGYKLPQVVFWNVASRNRNIPVSRSQTGAALVSGASPAIFDMVIGGEILSECTWAYDTSQVKDRVLTRILEETGGTTANVSCTATELSGGCYLISHDITVY